MIEAKEMPEAKKPSLTWIQCNEAIEEIHNPNEAEPADIQRISAWLWLNRMLYERAKKEWRSYSCTPPFGCNCTEVSGEYRLYGLYDTLRKVTDLHQKEAFYEDIVERFALIENNPEETQKWLINHFDRALDAADLLGIDFLDDYLDFNKSSYAVRSVFYSDNGVFVKREEFSNALKFLDIYTIANCNADLASM